MRKPVSIRVAVGMMLCLSTVIAEAQYPRDVNSAPRQGLKPAWEWTSSERAQARRNVDERRQRVAAFTARQPSQAMSVPGAADVIDGRRDPQLFFAIELFEHLVRSSFVALPEAYPQVVQQRSSDLFRQPAEWEQFAAIVSEYAALVRQEVNAAKALDVHRIQALQSDKCVAGARALREARHAFGRERFDRMLYETVPVGIVASFTADTDFDRLIASAREREEGCQ